MMNWNEFAAEVVTVYHLFGCTKYLIVTPSRPGKFTVIVGWADVVVYCAVKVVLYRYSMP